MHTTKKEMRLTCMCEIHIAPNIYILVDGPDIKNYLDLGYVYDKKQNILIIPSRKIESAFKNSMVVHELKVVE